MRNKDINPRAKAKAFTLQVYFNHSTVQNMNTVYSITNCRCSADICNKRFFNRTMSVHGAPRLREKIGQKVGLVSFRATELCRTRQKVKARPCPYSARSKCQCMRKTALLICGRGAKFCDNSMAAIA